MPSVNVAGVFGGPAVQHVVVTYDFSETRVYVDGRLRSNSPLIRGDFKTWDPRYFLNFGNEASGGRPWNGTLYSAAIYGRVLSAQEVADQRTAQSGSAGSPLAAFNFANSLDGTVRIDGKAAGANLALGMALPQRVAQFARAAFLIYDGRLTVWGLDTWDLVRNIILFLPFGLFGPAFVDRWTHSSALSAFLIVSAAAVVSVSCEALQFFEWERTSSVLDVVTNIAGAALGTFIIQKLTSYAAVWPRLTIFE